MVAETPQSAKRPVDTKNVVFSHSLQTEYLFLQKAPNQTMKTQAENILQHAIIRGETRGGKSYPYKSRPVSVLIPQTKGCKYKYYCCLTLPCQRNFQRKATFDVQD